MRNCENAKLRILKENNLARWHSANFAISHFRNFAILVMHAVGFEPTKFTQELLIYSQVPLPLGHACRKAGFGFLVLGL